MYKKGKNFHQPIEASKKTSNGKQGSKQKRKQASNSKQGNKQASIANEKCSVFTAQTIVMASLTQNSSTFNFAQAAQLTTSDERLQCAVCHYLLRGPLQLPCGHRVCTQCATGLKRQK